MPSSSAETAAPHDSSAPWAASAVVPFPRPFYVANVLELLERLGHYGMYIGLSLYLTNVVHMDDRATGSTLGNFRLVGALAPIVCGAIADRITFKRALVVAFSLYATGYICLYGFPTPGLATASLLVAAIGGGFMKPVIMGTVRRTSPPGRQREGFAIFYRMVNAGSVIGKTAAYAVRSLVALRHVLLNSVAASLCALTLAVLLYREPSDVPTEAPTPLRPVAPPASDASEVPAASAVVATEEAAASGGESVWRAYLSALRDVRFVALLLAMSGYYFMIEQFYMTFPKYVTRHIDPRAPLEIITLVNPALIALLQVRITRATSRVRPITTMVGGVAIASLSMFLMGAVPGIAGAVLSAAVFACAEMVFSPRFYDTIASFAPRGKAGMYAGFTFIPQAIGAWVGGQVSGRMIAAYLPATGPRDPFHVWSTYAAFGAVTAGIMFVLGRLIAGHIAEKVRA